MGNLPVGGEPIDAVGAEVGDVELPGRVDGQVARRIQLGVGAFHGCAKEGHIAGAPSGDSGDDAACGNPPYARIA